MKTRVAPSYWLIILLAVLMPAASCLPFRSYYVSYSNRLQVYDFTFEYPRTWTPGMAEQFSDSAYMIMTALPPSARLEAAPVLIVRVWFESDDRAEQRAQAILENELSAFGKTHNFNLVRRGDATVDSLPALEAEYTYQTAPEGAYLGNLYVTIRVLDRVVARKGKVYEIRIGASENEWTANQNDIQHLLDTFTWK